MLAPFTVSLSSAGNPDFGQDPRRSMPGVRKAKAKVATLRAASEACRKYIDDHELGGGNWTGGDVVDATGTLVATISYNGRAWPPGREIGDKMEINLDTGELQPLADRAPTGVARTPVVDQPTPLEAIEAIEDLLDRAGYPDIDASTPEGADMLIARWSVGIHATERLRTLACLPPRKGAKRVAEVVR